jgi:hypothetical protein
MLIFMATIACETKPMENKTGHSDAGTPETGGLIRIATTRTVPHASLEHCAEHEAMFNGKVQSHSKLTIISNIFISPCGQFTWLTTAQIAHAYVR